MPQNLKNDVAQTPNLANYHLFTQLTRKVVSKFCVASAPSSILVHLTAHSLPGLQNTYMLTPKDSLLVLGYVVPPPTPMTMLSSVYLNL